jgi:hypothetical protein
MQEMEAGRLLISAGEGEQLRFAVQISEKRETCESARAAGVLEIGDVF